MSAGSFLSKPRKNISYPWVFVPKVFEPTPFRAAALNSFFEVAESAKEKEKIYYSHHEIEVRKGQLKQKSTLVYNFQDRTLNPARLRASHYKYNRQTTLHKAEEGEVEMRHEISKL